MAEAIMAIVGVFIAYTLRKTDTKIDKTSSDLAAHILNASQVHARIREDTVRDFATKLELQEVEKRATAANRETQAKLDRIIDRLIDHPQSHN